MANKKLKSLIKNKVLIIFILYVLSIIIFAVVYLHIWNSNTENFRIDSEYKLNVFDLENSSYIPRLTEILESRKTEDDLKSNVTKYFIENMTKALEKLKIAEENKKDLWNCSSQPGFQDGNCLYHNNGIYTNIDLAKNEIAYIYLTYQYPIDLIDANLTIKLNAANEERRKNLNFQDFLMYSIHTSIGNSDSSIIANTQKVILLNIFQFVFSIIFLGILIDQIKNEIIKR